MNENRKHVFVIKPIQTSYKGYLFRSRLEARWAYFFDLMGIEYEYEKEGYELPSGNYLPDFWLPDVDLWAEVKPDKRFNGKPFRLAQELSAATNKGVMLLEGMPKNQTYATVAGGIPGGWFDYLITNHHDYPTNEHRFYSCPADYERFMDTETACEAAKSARFEHGEQPIMFMIPREYRSELVRVTA